MSNLTSIEKIKLEKIFDMGDGYVLDFSNRSFREFISENLGVDIYDDKYFYRSGSKANRLRGFWAEESNETVGELTRQLLEYWRTKKLLDHRFLTAEEEDLYYECQKIVGRLRQDEKESCDRNLREEEAFSTQQSSLLAKLDSLAKGGSPEENRRRGLILENLLENVFRLYKIPVKKSFTRNEGGEQIDGAFQLDGWYYLVECKWTQKLTDIRQLDSLSGKIGRSGRQTSGLFLSINGWSENVRPLLKQNQDKSIILMDGHDLRCVLVEHNYLDLKTLLLKKLECLNLEGEPSYSADRLLKER